MSKMLALLGTGLMWASSFAASPLWTFRPLTATTVAVPPDTTITVQYEVTNQSNRAKNLVIQQTTGLTQSSTCTLAPKGRPGSSCALTLIIDGSNLPEGGIQNGPRLCQANSDGSANENQCYHPAPTNVLHAVRLPKLRIGQPFQGGVVACLNSGLNNFIAATDDNSADIEWGGLGTAIGPGAQSNTDGASNTLAIVNRLGNNGGIAYAAKLCNNFEVDSQGNTPCQAGNTCYNDWFLPASPAVFGIPASPTSQLDCLWFNRNEIGGFDNNGVYWSSTQFGDSSDRAWGLNFATVGQGDAPKSFLFRVRCVRAFTP